MGLATPEKIQKLQKALHVKAKGTAGYRFYALYDKLYRTDILEFALRKVRASKGSPGVDGENFQTIEEHGRELWLGELAQSLKRKTYSPSPLKRIYIPKTSGGERPISIPTIKDRVVQTAAVILLSPIFEADLFAEQYAYRPERSALDAVKQVHSLLNQGYTKVIEADLSNYFGEIPHPELMKSVARRISDGAILHLIKLWLQMPIEETIGRGKTTRTTENRDNKKGIPQGTPISPLLSNLYMRRFLLGWKKLGMEERFNALIVNYADDLVICCKGLDVHEAKDALASIMEKLKLRLNEQKTSIAKLPTQKINFLGYTIGTCYSKKTGRSYIGTIPAKKSVQKVCREISRLTSNKTRQQEVDTLVKKINKVTTGWANYFKLGPVSKSYKSIDNHTRFRLRWWLCKKHRIPGRGTSRFPDEYLHTNLGLNRLADATRNLPWA